MSKTAIAALLGVGGALMIMKGVAGDASFSDAFTPYAPGKSKKEKNVDTALRGKSAEEWEDWQLKLQSIGFRAKPTGDMDDGTSKAVKDFRLRTGLGNEDDYEWNEDVEEAILREVEHLENEGVPKWFFDRILAHGYSGLEDFESSGQGVKFDNAFFGKAYVSDPSIGVFDKASMELLSKYEPYWYAEGYPPLPGPQFMTWDESKGKLILGPDHLHTQACVLIGLIDKVKKAKWFKDDNSSEWIKSYNDRWVDAPYWKQGAYNYLMTRPALLPILAPLTIADHVYAWWASGSDDGKYPDYMRIAMEAFAKSLLAVPLMFYNGRQIKISDWDVSSDEKKAALLDYLILIKGIVGGIVGAYKAGNGKVSDSQIKSVVTLKSARWSKDNLDKHFAIVQER